jgi:hypothetical protein
LVQGPILVGRSMLEQGIRGNERTKEVIKQDICGCHNEDDLRWDGKQTYLEIRNRMNEIFRFATSGFYIP